MESTPQPAAPPPKKNARSKVFMWFILLVVIVIVGVLGYSAYHHYHNTSKTKTSAEKQAPEPGYHQTEDQLRQYKQEATIEISADSVSPQTLMVPNDTKIIWHNSDTKPHTIAITSDESVPHDFFNNRTIEAENAYPYVVHSTGTFHYFLVDNPTVTGVVLVK